MDVTAGASGHHHLDMVREAAEKFFFLVAWPLRGGDKGLATKKNNFY